METVQQQDLTITVKDVRGVLSLLLTGEQQDPMGVKGFWIKIFQNLHKKMADYLQNRLNTEMDDNRKESTDCERFQ